MESARLAGINRPRLVRAATAAACPKICRVSGGIAALHYYSDGRGSLSISFSNCPTCGSCAGGYGWISIISLAPVFSIRPREVASQSLSVLILILLNSLERHWHPCIILRPISKPWSMQHSLSHNPNYWQRSPLIMTSFSRKTTWAQLAYGMPWTTAGSRIMYPLAHGQLSAHAKWQTAA